MPSLRHRVTSVLALSLLLVVIAGCGGSAPPPPPSPTGVVEVTGKVTLPAGHGLDLASLRVSTPLGVYDVGADGGFTAQVFGGAATEVGVETSGGELVLLGVTDDDEVNVSLTSTAEALLYYLVGGMWLPPAVQDDLRALLAGRPEAQDLAAELARLLTAGGNGMAEPDDDLVAAMEAAHASLLAAPKVRELTARALTERAAAFALALEPAASEGSNIVIEPSSALQAGAMVLHNPSGSGVVAQNQVRRPAALLAYEVGWENAEKVLTPVDPPELVERVEVPATGQLEFLNAIVDVLTGDSPWSPVLSPKLNLSGHQGASRTHYQLVLVGPTLTDASWPIMSDPRFEGFHDDWQDIVIEKSLELFLDELLLPLMEVYGLGSMAKLDAAKLARMRERVRVIHDPYMATLGVYLTQGQAGYANGLRFVIQELVENRTYRLDMMNMVREALEESDKNKAAIDAMERRLSGRASASAIAAAVQTVLVSGDVTRIMYDLAGAPSVVDWTAVSAPTLFALSPGQATVTRTNASARFSVIPKGGTSGNFLFRWSTTGVHGELSDLLQDGTTIVTKSMEAWYFHDSPLSIQDTDVDHVLVEVFEVEEGATAIPPGAQPVARMAAEVRGSDRYLDSRVDLGYDLTPPGMYRDDLRFGCAAMYLRFDAEPGAKSYLVSVNGVGGQGDERNSNQDFRLRGKNHTVYIDPNAKWEGSTIEEGYTPDWHGYCDWRIEDEFALPPYTFSAWYDREHDQYVVHLFTNIDHTGIVQDPVDLAERVDLWHQWLENAYFEVKVNK
jgi:hypothetical protein